MAGFGKDGGSPLRANGFFTAVAGTCTGAGSGCVVGIGGFGREGGGDGRELVVGVAVGANEEDEFKSLDGADDGGCCDEVGDKRVKRACRSILGMDFGLSSVEEMALTSMLLAAPFAGPADGFVGTLEAAGAVIVKLFADLRVVASVRDGGGAWKPSCTATDSGS